MKTNTWYVLVTFELMVQVAFVCEGTSVVYLESARINEETGTREIEREDIAIC